MAQLPEKIGKYEITGVAGEGAMGVVYIGHDPFVDRKVAIKVRHENLHDNENKSAKAAERMFFNEAQAAGALDHPNILKVHEAGLADGQPYIVTEFVENAHTLRDYCKADKQLPLDKLLRLMRQCADALDYAHRRGVTHRDIKPTNIMLTQQDDIKIVDFGIAQRNENDKTQVMGWFGSPLYMSPEQARDEQVTGQSDLFSLGVVLYELLTACRPFNATGISALIQHICTKDPEPIDSIRPEVPKVIIRIVNRALEKTLPRRYQTGAEMVADLDEAIAALKRPRMTDAQRFTAARRLKFFNDFSDSELSEFMKAAVWESFGTGDALIREGQTEKAFFILVTGEVSILRGDKEIAAVPAGECVGEMGYIGEGQRTATVCASEPVTAMKISAPLRDWASLPIQMRLNKLFQHTLIDRLASTSKHLSRQLR
jgi:serine/threonine protein kinase